MTTTESIMCVRSLDLERRLSNHQTIQMDGRSLVEILPPKDVWFGPRMILEADPGFRQLIPYVILRSNSRFGVYKRSRKSTEVRLAESWSIGFGGHVSLVDLVLSPQQEIDVSATLAKASIRELAEELHLTQIPISQRSVLIICDNDSEVGRVHAGVVQIWDLESEGVSGIDPAIENVSFVSSADLIALVPALENWSKICVKFLFGDGENSASKGI